MKTKTLLLFLCIISIRSFSQRNSKTDFERENFFRVGLKAGININQIDGKSFKDEFSYNYSLGGFMQFNVTRKIGIQPEVNFVQSSSESTNDLSDIYDDISLNGSQVKAKLNYLKLGGLLNYNVGPTHRIKLQLGPQYGFLVHQKTDTLTTQQDIFKKGDLSLVGGIMFQLPFVNLGARYEHGLTNINGIDNQDTWKNRAVQVFVGVTF